jgi:hypothetical protein
MHVALRRSTRVGVMSGTPLEDLGVIPDAIHKMTRDDVLQNNVDLIAHAASMLKDSRIHLLTGTLDEASPCLQESGLFGA